MFWIGIIIGTLLGWFCANINYGCKLSTLHKIPTFIPDDDDINGSVERLIEFIKTRKKIAEYEVYDTSRTHFHLDPEWEKPLYNSGFFHVLFTVLGIIGCRMKIEEKDYDDLTAKALNKEDPLLVTPPLTQEQEEPQDQEESPNP